MITTQISYTNESNVDFDQERLSLVYSAIQEVLHIEDKEICVLLTQGDRIRELNRRYRGKDKSTDVLSFPAEQSIAPIWGDIIIDTDVANSQKGNKSLNEEIIQLFIHGVLHLLGYDHIANHDQAIMKEKETIIWQLLVSRGYTW